MRRIVLPLLPVVLLAGCTHHTFVDPAVHVTAPDGYRSAPDQAVQEALVEASLRPAPWWTDFQDAHLEALVDRAFVGNLDLQAAWARLRLARSQVQVTRSAELVSADLAAGASQSQLFLPGGVATVDRNSVSLPMRFEADLFGKLNAATKASRLDLVASRDDLETIALSLSAEIAQTYFGLLEQRQRHALLGEQLDASKRVLESLETRYTLGQSSSLDYYQQDQLVKGIQAQREFLGSETARLTNLLAFLVGEAPRDAGLPEDAVLPDVPPLPPLGVPSDLLWRRPDVRSAFERVRAADYRVAQAVRDRLPNVSLGTTYSFQASDPSGLFRTLLRGFSADFLLPLFDGRRRRSTIEGRRAQLDEGLARYQKAFLQALSEVDTALAQEAAQQRYLDELTEQKRSADLAFRLASDRYQEGVEDFIRVLSALQSLHQVQLSVVQARAQLLRFRVQLCRSLGGGWTADLEPDRPLHSLAVAAPATAPSTTPGG